MRRFIARTLATAGLPGIDSDAATLLTSELVTNAILHTDSGKPGGSVTVVVRGLPDGLLVEVVDNGSAGTPVVKGDPLAGEGQGLHLVQQIASQWGYLRDYAGTTVWFHLATASPSGTDGPEAAQPSVAAAAGRRLAEAGRPVGQRANGQRPLRQYAAGQQPAAASTPAQMAARSSSLVT